jgi:predicted NAD/FAD-dependent oxidoreductase
MDETEVLIVGAGVAGLSCARTLMAGGLSVKVVDRSRAVGGRCALKAPGARVMADLGPVFVHGDDPEFLAWVETFGDDLIPGWPRVVEGTGAPCQPAAFEPGQRRFGLKSGLRTLADDLARGVDLVLGAEVRSFLWEPEGFVVTTDHQTFRARNLVLALALEQSRALLGNHPQVDALLKPFASLPCLTVVASYGPGTPAPHWDIGYPETSKIVLLASQEGTKRGLDPNQERLFVVQARPGWSASRLEGDRDRWAQELLDEAGRLWGAWATQPQAVVAHRWKYARLDPSSHLVRPVLFDRTGSTARLGLAGDLFHPDGGLQGAWKSGRRLAHRLLGVDQGR